LVTIEIRNIRIYEIFKKKQLPPSRLEKSLSSKLHINIQIAVIISQNQVCTLHGGVKQGIDQQSFNRKS